MLNNFQSFSMRSKGSFFLLFLVFLACSEDQQKTEKIIAQAIEMHGGDLYEQMELNFDFRDIHYHGRRSGGTFQFERHFSDSLGNTIRDVLTNEDFQRFVNDTLLESLEEKNRNAFRNSVNSVFYFMTLPRSLNDPAVNKKFLGSTKIKGQPYYKIEVRFEEEGGGDDFEDIFIFWIHKEKYTMDFLAYQYFTEGGGMRFREAYNVRYREGIRFADYRNFAPVDSNLTLHDLDQAFNQGELKSISDIRNTGIKVKLLGGS